MTSEPNHLQQSVLAVARKDVATLRQDLTVQQALDVIRQRGIGEKIFSLQSMTMTIQALRVTPPTFRWYVRAFRREAGTAAMLGAACGLVVGLIVWLWRGTGLAGFTIGASILLALCAACFFGLSVPALLHALKLDPKISAGPVTLAFTDLFTLLFYFSLAALVL
jgi:magnesium transporter